MHIASFLSQNREVTKRQEANSQKASWENSDMLSCMKEYRNVIAERLYWQALFFKTWEIARWHNKFILVYWVNARWCRNLKRRSVMIGNFPELSAQEWRLTDANSNFQSQALEFQSNPTRPVIVLYSIHRNNGASAHSAVILASWLPDKPSQIPCVSLRLHTSSFLWQIAYFAPQDSAKLIWHINYIAGQEIRMEKSSYV